MVLQELLFLFRIGKLRLKRYKSENDIVSELNNLDIKIIFFNKYHFEQYKNLTIAPNHKDMNDHAILAQAISDKITLISSDNDFKKYTAQGLSFLYNQR
jgi:PIN domain nuclease of toxin-antitoxin system